MGDATYILGIDTSFDETACSIVADGRDVLGNTVASQIELHRRFGGVVPEIASRAHIEAINAVIDETLADSSLRMDQIAAVAVAHEPGLIGSLLIGLMTAKTISWVRSVPLIAVNHIYAHAYAPALESQPIDYPAVALICSGGHTVLYHCQSPTELELLGSTIDDAAGEAFDKVASILNLGFPGGPVIDATARSGDPAGIEFPRSFLSGKSLDFSFSGLKTAVLYYVNGVPGRLRPGRRRKIPSPPHATGIENFTAREVADIAASFQVAVVDVLRVKLRSAVKKLRTHTVILGGGVAANSALRSAVERLGTEMNCKIFLPKMEFCLDNAAMIAGLGYHYHRMKKFAGLDLEARAALRR